MTTLAITGGLVLRPDFRVERADVLIDRDKGRVVDVGTGFGADTELDATDGVVMPGLINAHCHVAMSLLRGYADDKPLDRWLQEDIWPVEAALEPADVAAGARLGIAEMIASGTTAFVDMYFHVPEIAEVVAKAGIRARLGHGIISVGKDSADAWEDLETGIEIADRFDGAADGRISTAIMPHSLTTVGEEYLQVAVQRAAEIGVPIHFHANESVSEVEPILDERHCRPLEYAESVGLLDGHGFLAHGVHLTETEIDLLSATGTSVVHCPASNMKLASGMAPVQQLLDAGVTVGIGTDGPASNNDLDMFDEMRDAAMVGKLRTGDPRAVDAQSVVRMATTGSANAAAIPCGRLEPDGPADLIVLDFSRPGLTPVHDVVSHLAYAVVGADVRHTICDGEVLMRDRQLTTIPVDDIRQDAIERAEDLISRANEN